MRTRHGRCVLLPGRASHHWRSAFWIVLQRALVTSGNRAGTIYLELADTLAHKQILVQAIPDKVTESPV